MPDTDRPDVDNGRTLPERLSSEGAPVGVLPSEVIPGECPVCGQSAVWADPVVEGSRRVLLSGKLVSQLSAGSGRTWVVITAVGRPQVVEPWLFNLHVCPPDTVTEAIGYYSSDVLRHSCPVVLCHVPPGELCVSTRHEVLLRPHGARRALAERSEVTDVSSDDVI